jgi:CheY-like chemotaxis protein
MTTLSTPALSRAGHPQVVAVRSDVELAVAQLHAIDAWHAERHRRESELQDRSHTREGRLDAARAVEALRRAHSALVDHVAAQSQADEAPLSSAATRRLVVVHRNAWFAEKVRRLVAEQGVQVVAEVDNGADGLGILVAEQPDLLLLEDALPMVTGEEIAREAARFAAPTAVVVQVTDEARIGPLMDAGAVAVFHRRVPPVDVANELGALVGRS